VLIFQSLAWPDQRLNHGPSALGANTLPQIQSDKQVWDDHPIDLIVLGRRDILHKNSQWKKKKKCNGRDVYNTLYTSLVMVHILKLFKFC